MIRTRNPNCFYAMKKPVDDRLDSGFRGDDEMDVDPFFPEFPLIFRRRKEIHLFGIEGRDRLHLEEIALPEVFL